MQSTIHDFMYKRFIIKKSCRARQRFEQKWRMCAGLEPYSQLTMLIVNILDIVK